jgi:hypothetical protein
MEVGLVYQGILTDRWRVLEMQYLTVWELCEGNMKDRLLYCGCLRICTGRLWKWATLSIRPQ